jgi:hypothetical protein
MRTGGGVKIRRKKLRPLRVEIVCEAGHRVFKGPDEDKALRLTRESEPYHEAAHAVIALSFWFNVTVVTVQGGEAASLSGDDTITAGTVWHGEAAADLNAIVTMAGVLWDAEYGGLPFAIAQEQASGDNEMFCHYAPSEEEKNRAIERARALIKENKVLIQAVGRVLADKRRLTGDEVRAIMASVSA